MMCKYCDKKDEIVNDRIIENSEDYESSYAIVEYSNGWFFTSCSEEKFNTYKINFCPMCGKQLRINREVLEFYGVKYDESLDYYDVGGCPSDFGLENSDDICNPSGDGCSECCRNAMEEVWFGLRESEDFE